jgi:hypothetical protein
MNWFTTLIRNIVDGSALRAELAEEKRLARNSLAIALNAGRQLAVLLESNPLDIVPVLSADGLSSVVEYETVTVVFTPSKEEFTVRIRETTQRATFPMVDGDITSAVQDQVLGILLRSRRTDKSIRASLSLKASGEPISV